MPTDEEAWDSTFDTKDAFVVDENAAVSALPASAAPARLPLQRESTRSLCDEGCRHLFDAAAPDPAVPGQLIVHRRCLCGGLTLDDPSGIPSPIRCSQWNPWSDDELAIRTRRHDRLTLEAPPND